MLKKIRKEKGLTQKELAEKLGVSQPKYSRFENCIDISTLEKMERLMEVSATLDVCPFTIVTWITNHHLGDKIELDNFLKHHKECSACPYKLTTCPCYRKE